MELIVQFFLKRTGYMADTMETQAMKSFHELCMIITRMVLIEKSISESTRHALMVSMQKMDWEGRYKRSEELISILETSKTEQEILDMFFSLSNY